MTLWFGSDEAEILWEGSDEVAMRWEGSDEVFDASAAPPGPQRASVTFDYVNDVPVTFTLRGVEITATPVVRSSAPRALGLLSSSASRRAAAQAWDIVTVTINGFGASILLAGFYNRADDSIVLTLPSRAVPTSGTVVITSIPNPPPQTLPANFDMPAAFINAAAAGRFGSLEWQFSHAGQDYLITHCFTHANGWQLRFATAAQAQAFIAAGFTVSTGIPGQQTFKSSVMDNIFSPAIGAQYRAFPGRYMPFTDYTVTISE